MKLCMILSALGLACVVILPFGSFAGENEKPPTGSSPPVHSRADKPYDWSSFAAVPQLPADWSTDAVTGLNLAPDQLTGTAWRGFALPDIRPGNKAPFEARLDGAKDDSRVGATLSRSVPLGHDLSLTWQNTLALTQPVTPTAFSSPYVPQFGFISPHGIVGQSSENREIDQSLRFKIAPYGTTLLAGTATSATDEQWHNRLSIEQALPGSLNVTTSVQDAGSGASSKSITAGFKKVW